MAATLRVGGLAMGHSFVVNRKDLEYRNSFGAVVRGWGGDWENGKAPEMTVATAARPRAVRDAPEPSPSKRLKWQLPR